MRAEKEAKMPAERFEFANAQGERLAGLIDGPAGEPRAYALFAHCFTCGKDVQAARRIAERLTATGIGVLRFDFTGLGGSEGEFANTNFSSNVADLVAAADALRPTAFSGTSRALDRSFHVNGRSLQCCPCAATCLTPLTTSQQP
jgi:hypothetical protein